MPAATGTRFVIVSRSGGPSQRVAARKACERAGGEVLAVDAGADDVVAAAVGVLEHQLVGERERLDERDERVVAVAARAADEEADVDLRGREQAAASAALTAPSSSRRSARHSARRELLGARVGRAADRLERGAGAVADPRLGARGERRASARAPCAGARSRAGPARAAPARAPARGGSSPTRTESTFGTGWKTVRETGRSTRTSQASWASTEGTP